MTCCLTPQAATRRRRCSAARCAWLRGSPLRRQICSGLSSLRRSVDHSTRLATPKISGECVGSASWWREWKKMCCARWPCVSVRSARFCNVASLAGSRSFSRQGATSAAASASGCQPRSRARSASERVSSRSQRQMSPRSISSSAYSRRSSYGSQCCITQGSPGSQCGGAPCGASESSDCVCGLAGACTCALATATGAVAQAIAAISSVRRARMGASLSPPAGGRQGAVLRRRGRRCGP
jgi:hypothetical protein